MAMRCVTVGSLIGAAALAMACGPTEDMFACGVTPDCVQNRGHLWGPEEAELRCGGGLVASGKPGAVRWTSSPGPYSTRVEGLVVLLGNGRLFQQHRMRCTGEDNCDPDLTTEWEREALELCDVDVEPADIAGCGDPNQPCSWSAHGKNCEEPEDWSCQDLPSF